MGTIQQMAQEVKYAAGQALSNITSGIKNKFDEIVGGLQAKVEGLFSGDVVGINTNEIPNMQNAIASYIEGLEAHLIEMKTNATTDEAFKGQYAGAITDFVAAVKDCCYAVISQLEAFSAQLDEVKVTYEERDQQLASDISSQADELRSAYQAFDQK